MATVDTVSGVERLTWPESGAPALDWTLDTATVIGGFEASGPDYQFDQVRPGGLVGDPAGNVYVLDGTGLRVVAYGPTGEFIGSWGREGNGPGELARPGSLAVAPDGTLWITDDGNRRLDWSPCREGHRVLHYGFQGAGHGLPMNQEGGVLNLVVSFFEETP